MPPVEAVAPNQDAGKETDSISKPMVGIIYPPPEVRNIVDKTASFVARNGPDFESRIRQNEINNPKFNFLNIADPYHAYYQHKVKEFGEGRGQEPAAPVKTSAPRAPTQQEVVKLPEVIIPKEPPPEPEFIADPPSISSFDLDIVKLTAQFVARNGRTFLTNLMNREQRNYQFDFLRPQHSLFNYFTKLVEQYTKVLIPPKDLMGKLKLESEEPKEILRQVNYRVQWTKMQEQAKRKEEEAKEKERVAYASIDWHDFVVVETVDYQPGEIGLFPLPTSPEEVGARVIMQERQEQVDEPEKKAEDEMELSDREDGEPQDMDEDSGDEVEMPAARSTHSVAGSLPGQPMLGKNIEQIIVRRDYDPKQARTSVPQPQGAEQWLVSPLTNEKIPAHKLQEHIKISLLDPKWREQKERTIREKSEQENVYATGENIEMNLRGIAERRTDIFGHGGEEAEIGKKIGEEEIRRPEKAVWDGHTASMEKVSQRARENISIEEQIAVIHKAKGLVEDDAKNKIGPSTSTRVPVEPLMSQPVPPPPPVSRAVAPSQQQQQQQQVPSSVPPLVQLAPQGVPAPAPRPMMAPMMAAPPGAGMVLMQSRPQPQLLQPAPMMGVPMASMAAIPQMRPVYQPVLAPAPVAPVPAPVPAVEDEPPSKKSKTEESLLPEGTWLAQQPGPVTIHVQTPSMPEKPEWNLNGQTVSLTISLTEMVGAIKAQMCDRLGMPVGKQKLQYDGMFIKDSNSLAFYNFMPDSLVQLTTKERGGRKK